jgi:pimeloyl-ACP methyl ester carboxylesterase
VATGTGRNLAEPQEGAHGRVPLVLVPGLLCDGRLWADQVSGLRDVVKPVIADVTRGSSVVQMAQAVLEVAPGGRFALAGLSMGGYVALEVIRAAPERISHLALLDTSARPDSPEQTDARYELMKLARTGHFGEVPRELLPRLVHPERMDDERLCSIVFGMAEAVGPEAFVRQEEAIIGRPDSREDLQEIACPTLVLCGRDDLLTPVHLHEEMAVRIPDSDLVILERCGHLSTLECPAEVTTALRAWLA